MTPSRKILQPWTTIATQPARTIIRENLVTKDKVYSQTRFEKNFGRPSSIQNMELIKMSQAPFGYSVR